MLKKSSVFVGIITFFIVATMSAPGVFAKRNYFEVKKFGINKDLVDLSKPSSKTSTAGNISRSVSMTRPNFKLYFKKMRNKKKTSEVNLQLDISPTDTSDLRSITMNSKVIIKTNKKSEKIRKMMIKGGKFTYEGTNSSGGPVNGGTLDVFKGAISAQKNRITLKSEILLDALPAESKIDLIGKQAGDYDYTLTITGTKMKYMKKALKKIEGVLTVTE